MLEHEGASVHYYTLPWIHAKVRANEVLNLAQRVLEIYCSNECQDLTIPGGGRVGAGMEAKLRTLLTAYTLDQLSKTSKSTTSPKHTS